MNLSEAHSHEVGGSSFCRTAMDAETPLCVFIRGTSSSLAPAMVWHKADAGLVWYGLEAFACGIGGIVTTQKLSKLTLQ